MTKTVKENIAGFVFITPVLLGLLIFTATPFILSFWYSFTDYDNFTAPIFNNFANYKLLFYDPTFLNSLKVTFIFALVSVVFSLFLSFFFALMLNQNIKGIKVFRVLLYTPVIIPGVAVAAIWQDMFNPTYQGLINRLLAVVNIEPQAWFTSSKTAFNTLIGLSLWGLGSNMLMWIAGFNSISPTYYEAAEIDGANRIDKLFKITLPMVSPVIFYNMVMGIISSFQVFGNAYLLTGGGPDETTNFLALNIYRLGISKNNMGYASAQAWVMLLIILVLTLVVFKTSGWVYYGDEDTAKKKKKRLKKHD